MSGAWELVINSRSPEETLALGRLVGESLVGGLVIGLIGPLGAGKTQFVKGVASGNAAPDTRLVTSPTFTLLQEYTGRLTLYHLDAYRLPGSAALTALGFGELIRADSVVAVEWADRVTDLLPPDALMIRLACEGAGERRLEFHVGGDPARRVSEKLRIAVKNGMIDPS